MLTVCSVGHRSPLLRLPVEIINKIARCMRYLDRESLANLALVNSDCRAMARAAQFQTARLGPVTSGDYRPLNPMGMMLREEAVPTTRSAAVRGSLIGRCIRRLCVDPGAAGSRDYDFWLSRASVQDLASKLKRPRDDGKGGLPRALLRLAGIRLCHEESPCRKERYEWLEEQRLSAFFHKSYLAARGLGSLRELCWDAQGQPLPPQFWHWMRGLSATQLRLCGVLADDLSGLGSKRPEPEGKRRKPQQPKQLKQPYWPLKHFSIRLVPPRQNQWLDWLDRLEGTPGVEGGNEAVEMVFWWKLLKLCGPTIETLVWESHEGVKPAHVWEGPEGNLPPCPKLRALTLLGPSPLQWHRELVRREWLGGLSVERLVVDMENNLAVFSTLEGLGRMPSVTSMKLTLGTRNEPPATMRGEDFDQLRRLLVHNTHLSALYLIGMPLGAGQLELLVDDLMGQGFERLEDLSLPRHPENPIFMANHSPVRFIMSQLLKRRPQRPRDPPCRLPALRRLCIQSNQLPRRHDLLDEGPRSLGLFLCAKVIPQRWRDLIEPFVTPRGALVAKATRSAWSYANAFPTLRRISVTGVPFAIESENNGPRPVPLIKPGAGVLSVCDGDLGDDFDRWTLPVSFNRDWYNSPRNWRVWDTGTDTLLLVMLPEHGQAPEELCLSLALALPALAAAVPAWAHVQRRRIANLARRWATQPARGLRARVVCGLGELLQPWPLTPSSALCAVFGDASIVVLGMFLFWRLIRNLYLSI